MNKKTNNIPLEPEALWHAIVQCSPDGIAISTLDGVVQLVSAKLLDMYSLTTADEITGRHIYDLIDPAFHEKAKSRLEEVLKGKSVAMSEYNQVRKDGSNLLIESNVAVLRNAQGVATNLIHIIRDISGRKEAELAILKNEEKYHNIFENMQDVYFETSVEGTILEISPSIQIISKGQYRPEDLLGRSIFNFYLNIEERNALLIALRENGSVRNFEVTLLNKDGSSNFGMISCKFAYNALGLPEKIIGSLIDITVRKQAENLLKLSEEKFSTAFNISPMAICITMFPDGAFIDCNDAMIKLSGYGREELIGKSPLDLGLWFKPEDREFILQRISKDRSLRNYEINFRVKGGNIYTTNYSGEIIEYGSETCLLSIIEDITEKKEAEKRIVLLAHSLESISDCVSVTDLNNKIIYINESFLKTYGYTEDELIGQNIQIIRPHPAEDTEIQDILQKTIDDSWHGETMNKRKDGSLFPVLLSTSGIRDEKGDLVALVGVATDITTMRKTKEELIEAKEQAENANRLKTALLNNLSHEIRTPMNAILGFSDLMNEANAEEKDTYAEVIYRSSNELLSMIDDVMLLSRLQSEKMPLVTRNFKPSDVVKEICVNYSRYDSNKGLEIVANIPEQYGNLTISADKIKIIQILRCLTTNALKYTFKGRVEIGFELKNKLILFYVADTGIGISMEEKELIFDTFYRGKEAIDLAIRGYGLGLNIAKELATQIRGTIGLTSLPTIGSRFELTIPLVVAGKEASHRATKQISEKK